MQICDGEEEMKNGATKKCENVKVQCGQGEGVILIHWINYTCITILF